ncbi:MAG: DUF389 domain-containing protein [Planctomycetota bacterium]|jgi:uncharacterized hydrophobic protein (TIGR00271 family)|nr:DUF389 domain-containing protein [Planctomycetota bacterium]
MPILVVVTAPEQAPALVRWGMRFALAQETGLSLLAVERARNDGVPERVPFTLAPGESAEDGAVVAALRDAIEPARAALGPDAIEPGSGSAMAPVIRRLRHPKPASSVLELADEIDCDLLIVGALRQHHDSHGETDLPGELFKRSACTILLMRGVGAAAGTGRVLVPVAGGPHADAALSIAARLGSVHAGTCTALYVSPEAGADAAAVGEHHLHRALERAKVPDNSAVTCKVILGDDVRKAIALEAAKGYDLVVVGATGHGSISRLLFGTVGEHLLGAEQALAVAVIRRADPLHARLWLQLSRWAHARVPQLDRSERVSLSERLFDGSRCGFDFIALIVLSTTIAGLGLIQSSTAVVVGAMLVAPLMTPIVGAGLALVQGNAVLVRESARSIAIGFCTAFGIGLALGVLTPINHLTPELLARGAPNLLDMGIAFVSGVAGAYAMARPNLSAALPGVAIAAALVPPIATVGICLAIGEVAVARGALLLFGTNVVAIILGAALALYAVGLRAARGRPWPLWGRRLVGGLLGTLAVLAVPLSMVMMASWHRPPPERVVTEELRHSVSAALPGLTDARLTQCDWVGAADSVLMLDLESSHLPREDLARRLAARLNLPAGVSVRVRTTIISEATTY